MKQWLKSLAKSTRLWHNWRSLLNFWYDYRRFIAQSGTRRSNLDQVVAEAHIVMDYHRLEKGLSFAQPKATFGLEVSNRLLDNLEKYVERFGYSRNVAVSLNVLENYLAFRRSKGLPESLLPRIVQLRSKMPMELTTEIRGGTHEITRDSIFQSLHASTDGLFTSRHSVRDFDDSPINLELVRKAVNLAIKTPSVCNRQCWKLYFIDDPAIKNSALALQNGNRGFGHRAGVLFVVASDLRNFVTLGERNQAWIDGGLFSMSLIYALHSQGLGTCCLNWSVEIEQDKALHQLLDIPEYEVVIMLLAIGNLPERFRVPDSPRKSVDEVLNYVHGPNYTLHLEQTSSSRGPSISHLPAFTTN